MGKIAFVFSGQGAQYPGMGQDFYRNNNEVYQLFNQAENFRNGTIDQCFNSEIEVLKKTENTQPCVYLADIAAAIALKTNGIKPDAVAGFSLGEIPALAFAGAYSYLDGFQIVVKRGELMSSASNDVKTAMMAVLKLDNEKVEQLCGNYSNVYPVNYNCQGQLVVSGNAEQLDKFKDDVKSAGGRAVPLAVSGAFHSPFMSEAADKFYEFLEHRDIQTPQIPVYSNYTAKVYSDDVKMLLKKQIDNPVYFEKIILNMVNNGFDAFIEVGVGNTLQKLISRIAPESKSYAVEKYTQITDVLKELN